jgi:hypothetical protein
MREPYATGTAVFFYLQCGHEQRTFIVSNSALRLLARRLGYIMDYLNLYRAHEALIHATARAVAAGCPRDTLYLDAFHFAAEPHSAMHGVTSPSHL